MAEPLTWRSASAAEDLLFVGLVDALGSLEASGVANATILGGVMVELLVRERALRMPRATKDVDVGLHVNELQRVPLVAELEARDYERRKGHIFVKESLNPAGESSIDVLVPAYTSRQSRERRIGALVTIEVGMLAEALATAGPKDVRLITSAGAQMDLRVPLPHPLAALTLKLSAWEARRAGKDAFDVWRCLEICAHERLGAQDWEGIAGMRAFAERVRMSAFGTLQSAGVVSAVDYANLEGTEAERRAARIVALGHRLFTDVNPLA